MSILQHDFETFEEPPTPTKPKIVSIGPRVSSLNDLNIEDEVLNQFYVAKEMLAEADREPLSQRAAMVGAVTTILKNITTLRTDLYTSQRLVVMESCLIAVLKEFPEMSQAFMARYSKALELENAR